MRGRAGRAAVPGGAGPASSWKRYSTPHWPPPQKGKEQSGKANHTRREKCRETQLDALLAGLIVWREEKRAGGKGAGRQ